MPTKYVILPIVAMTILPLIASKLETWRKGCYKEFTWPKHWAKMFYMSLALPMLFIDWRASMAMYFGVVVYLMVCQIRYFVDYFKLPYDEYFKKHNNSPDILLVGFYILLDLIYCLTDYGCIVIPFALIPYGFILFYRSMVKMDENIKLYPGGQSYHTRSDYYDRNGYYGYGSKWRNHLAYLREHNPNGWEYKFFGDDLKW